MKEITPRNKDHKFSELKAVATCSGSRRRQIIPISACLDLWPPLYTTQNQPPSKGFQTTSPTCLLSCSNVALNLRSIYFFQHLFKFWLRLNCVVIKYLWSASVMMPNLLTHQLEETEKHRCSKCHCTVCSPVTWRRYELQKQNVIKHFGDSGPPHPQY